MERNTILTTKGRLKTISQLDSLLGKNRLIDNGRI